MGTCFLLMAAVAACCPTKHLRLGGIDFAARWRRLVEQGEIQAVSNVDRRLVRYGLRVEKKTGTIQEFAEDSDTFQSVLPEGLSKRAGEYPVRLAAIRRLRPPSTFQESEIPPHDSETCSLCGGPQRLQLREPLGKLMVPTTGRVWDCHFNIAPQQTDGHGLLVPTLDEEANRRKQALLFEDIVDLTTLAFTQTILPRRSLCINFNAPGAGASQNHIHAHVWVQHESYPIDKYPLSKKRWDMKEGKVSAAIVKGYPAASVCFLGRDPKDIALAVSNVITTATTQFNLTYNFLISGLANRKGGGERRMGVYVFLRGSDAYHESPLGLGQRIGAGMMAGEWIVTRKEVFELLNEDKIAKALALTRPDALQGDSIDSGMVCKPINEELWLHDLLNEALGEPLQSRSKL
ncbi:hypothetical protein AAMO2058_000486600 [Amorphochlora amoebiformis]